MRLARAAHLVVAALALLGLALSFSSLGALHPGRELGWRLVRFFGFFTNLSNALVAVCGIGYALPGGAWHRWTIRPGTRTAISVYIFFVGLIFQLLLAGLMHFSGIGWWGNLLVHQAVPIGWLLCWFAFGPHGRIGKGDPLWWMIFPLAYAAVTVVHGITSGWYPYPFLNAPSLGWPVVTRNLVLLIALFAALCWIFRWIDGRLAMRSPV